MRLIITVNFEPGDVPDVRPRVTMMRGMVGELLVDDIRARLKDNLYIIPEWLGFDPETFKPAKIGRITTRLET